MCTSEINGTPRQIIFLSPLGSRAGHVGTRPFQPLLRGGRHKTLNTPETLKYFPSGNTEEIQSVGAVTVINITSNNRIINLRWKKKKSSQELRDPNRNRKWSVCEEPEYAFSFPPYSRVWLIHLEVELTCYPNVILRKWVTPPPHTHTCCLWSCFIFFPYCIKMPTCYPADILLYMKWGNFFTAGKTGC